MRTPFACAAGVTAPEHVVDGLDERNRSGLQPQHPGQGLRRVEQIGRQPRLQPHVPLDRLQPARRGCRVELAGSKQMHPTENRVQRRPQLVGDRRQELVLHAAGRFALAARIVRLARLLLGFAARDAKLGDQRRQQQSLDHEEREVGAGSGVGPADNRVAPRANERTAERGSQSRTGARQPRRRHHRGRQQQKEGAVVNQRWETSDRPHRPGRRR